MFSKRMSNRNTFYVFYSEYLYKTYPNISWYFLDTVPVLIYSLTIFKINSRMVEFIKYLLYILSQFAVLKYF